MADVDWAKIGNDWVAWREEWRSAATDMKPLKETEVREKLMVPLLAALGWAQNEYHTEVICSIKIGSDKAKEVEADYVLAPLSCVRNAAGRTFWTGEDSPWAVIEVKRPGQNEAGLNEAKAQARSYSDHVRVPVYAVVDGDVMCVWHRRLVRDDELMATIELKSAAAFVERAQDIERFLGAKSLKDLRQLLWNKEIESVAAAHSALVDPAHRHERDVYWEFLPATSSLAMPEGLLADVGLSSTWWGKPNGTGAATPVRLALAGSFAGNPQGVAPELCALVCRLLLNDAIRDLFVDEPEDWKRVLAEFPVLAGNVSDLTRARSRVSARNLQIPPRPVVALSAPLSELIESWSDALDRWTLEDVRARIDALLSAYPTVEQPTLWSEATVADRMRLLWKNHSAAITGSLLRSMLQNGSSTRQALEARVRFGPNHTQRMVDCVLFSLAVSDWAGGMSLRHDGRYEDNLRVGSEKADRTGFTYALPELHPQEDPLVRMSMFAEKAHVLIFTEVARSAPALAERHPIGRSSGGLPVIGAEPGQMLFALKGDAASAIRKGWSEFSNHLRDETSSLWRHPDFGNLKELQL